MIRIMIKVMVALVILISVSSCKEERIKISDKKVVSKQAEIAENIVKRLFHASKKGLVARLSKSESTNDMIGAFEPEKQRELFDALEQAYGDFVSLKFIEAYKIKDVEAVILRYKGIFTKKDKVPEIRITIDYTSRFSNFSIKPWSDEMK